MASTLRLQVLQAPALIEEPFKSQHLASLNTLLNTAYHYHDNSDDPSKLFEGQRIKTDDQLFHELGRAGKVAVLFDSLSDRVVAIAAVKPWKGKTIDLWHAAQQQGSQPSSTQVLAINGDIVADSVTGPRGVAKDEKTGRQFWDWEITTCASLDEPQYRRRGLVGRCVDAVLGELRRMEEMVGIKSLEDEDMLLRLWVTALEGVGNAEYWMRRGFVRDGEPDHAPKGLWGAYRPFRIGTLYRVLEGKASTL